VLSTTNFFAAKKEVSPTDYTSNTLSILLLPIFTNNSIPFLLLFLLGGGWGNINQELDNATMPLIRKYSLKEKFNEIRKIFDEAEKSRKALLAKQVC